MEVVNTVGRRKAAVARVYVKPGKGQITINRKALEVYFPLEILQYQVKQPLLATNTVENYDIVINLDGGGITGQASAARLGIARALCEIDAEMRPALKRPGSSRAIPARLSVRSPVSPEHAASSSSASVNRTTGFRQARCGLQTGKTTYIIYTRITFRLPRRGKPVGSARPLPVGLKKRELKLTNTIELKCHVQILIHYWKPVRTSVT